MGGHRAVGGGMSAIVIYLDVISPLECMGSMPFGVVVGGFGRNGERLRGVLSRLIAIFPHRSWLYWGRSISIENPGSQEMYFRTLHDGSGQDNVAHVSER